MTDDKPPMPINKGSEIELEIDNIAFGGDGVGRSNDFVVFVPHTAPGDRARVLVHKKKKRFAHARLTAVISPSPDRIEPGCRHFTQCGGCSWQHLPYEKQLEFKAAHTRECLQKIAGIPDPPLRPILPAANPWNYRNKMEFTFGRDAGGSLTLGLLRPGFFNRVVDLEECLLPDPAFYGILDLVREFARKRGLAPYDKKTHEGFLRNLIVRSGSGGAEHMVGLVTAGGDFAKFSDLANRIVNAFPTVKSALRVVNDGLSDTASAGAVEALYGEDSITETLLGNRFEVSLFSFMQSNSRQSEALYRTAIEALELKGTETVLDVYCGMGAITLAIARRAASAIGIESHPAAAADARRNAEANGIANAVFIEGSAEKVLPELFATLHPDAILIDPPRAGAHPKALKALVESQAPKIVYVSCNPSTLARDVSAMISSGYRLQFVQPVDMFPQTPHIECVALLARD